MDKELSFSIQHPEYSPGMLLWQTTALWHKNLKSILKPKKLSHAEFVVLAVVNWLKETNQPSTQSMIGYFSKLDKMTVSNSLRKLVNKGLVLRKECEKDTRSKISFLTDKGCSLAIELTNLSRTYNEDFFSILDEDEKKTLNRLFLKLIR